MFHIKRSLSLAERVSGPGRVHPEGPGALLHQRDHGSPALLGLPVPGEGPLRPSESRELGLPAPPRACRVSGGDGKGGRVQL